MKTLSVVLACVVALASILVSAPAPAATNFVTSAVFKMASSAVTATPNLRVQPMGPKSVGRDQDTVIMQTFLRQAGTTQNLYLTGGVAGVSTGHSQTVDLSTALCLYIEVDQDTRMYLNSETAYILLPSGTREVQCFK